MQEEVPADTELSVASLKSDAAPSAGHPLVTGPVHCRSMASTSIVVSRLKCRVTTALLFPVDVGHVTVTEQCCTVYTRSHSRARSLIPEEKATEAEESSPRSRGTLE